MRTLRIGAVAIVLAAHALLPCAGTDSTVKTAAGRGRRPVRGGRGGGLRRQGYPADHEGYSAHAPPAHVARTSRGKGRRAGKSFEVTAEVAAELRRLGFRPAQIDAIKESSPEPLVPGKWLTTSDERRNQNSEEMKQVAVKSGAAIEPIESQHVTLWAAKETQQKYLPDVQKLEKFFHTRCAEPIRSGLDKRSTHVVLLKDHAEYEAWCRAMFNLFGKQFDGQRQSRRQRASPGRDPQAAGVHWWDFVAISVGEVSSRVHRHVAAGVGTCTSRNWRLSRRGPLQTGFINGAETAVFGSPTIMFAAIVYGARPGTRVETAGLEPAGPTAHGDQPGDAVGELLQMDHSKMLQPHYAEAWTLVGLLNKQPAKFGELLLG